MLLTIRVGWVNTKLQASVHRNGFSLIAVSTTSISTIEFVLMQQVPGLTYDNIQSMPFYEFVRYKELLERKMKEEKEAAERQQQEIKRSQKTNKHLNTNQRWKTNKFK